MLKAKTNVRRADIPVRSNVQTIDRERGIYSAGPAHGRESFRRNKFRAPTRALIAVSMKVRAPGPLQIGRHRPKLRPCRFCGSKHLRFHEPPPPFSYPKGAIVGLGFYKIVNPLDDGHRIVCDDCGAIGPRGGTCKRAARKWNGKKKKAKG